MMLSAKGPSFFCENCGTTVPRDAKKCPSCGRFFANVRCPVCNFVGPEGIFVGGCPICGYSSSIQKNKYTNGIKKPSEGGIIHPLPWWVYGITLLAFIFVMLLAILMFTG